MNKRSIGRFWKLALSFSFAGFFVWLILRSVSGEELGDVLSQTRTRWVITALVLFLAGYVCRIIRWRIMLLRDNPDLSWVTCAVPFMGSIAANNVLPFRAGDVLRAVAFTKWLGVSTTSTIATLLVERLLDLLSLLIVLGTALVIFDLSNGSAGMLIGISGTSLILIGLGVMVFLLFPQLFEPLVRSILRGVAYASPPLADKLTEFSEKIFDTLRHLARGPRMTLLVLWSAGVWGFEGAVFFACAMALPAITDPQVSLLALPVGTLATLLPSTPGYVGTFDYFVIEAMEVMGNPGVAATAFALLVHLILWVPATLIGGACLTYWSLRSREPSKTTINKALHK